MSEPASSEPVGEPSRQIDRTLLAESRLYGVAYQAYADMTPRMRGAVKGKWAREIRSEAKRRRIDPDEFLSMTPDAREQARKDYPERPQVRAPAVAPAAKSFEEVMSRHQPSDGEDPPPEPPRPPKGPVVAPMVDEGLTDGDLGDDITHSSMDEVPPTEFDPAMRAHATLGAVLPKDNEDLAGWEQPRNLLDVYARYSIGDGQHFIRVERMEPKVWQGIPCAGPLGQIREPITEPEFHSWYGGRVYQLTVYGPDPRGRHDPVTGLPVIKAKTAPFKYTVPLLPPNLAMRQGTHPIKQQQGETPMMSNPFGFATGAPPTTPADAQVHKSTLDFMTQVLNRSEDEKKELRRQQQQGASPSESVLKIVQESGKDAVAQATRALEFREQALQEQLREERAATRALEAKMERLLEKDQERQQNANPVKDAVHLVQTMQPGKSAEEEMVRLRQGHMEELNRIREQQRETMTSLKDRQEDELKRLRDRLDEVERHGRERFEDAEKRFRERERELKDQIDAARREERDVAERRVKETVDRFEDRLKDVRLQHDRELRMQGEQHTTRVDTTKSNLEMQVAAAKERVKKLEEDLAEAQEEAEKSKDPVAVMRKGTELAEALGFKKDDDGPQTAGERFAGTVAVGLSKALESMSEWLPRAMEARGPRTPALPPGPRALPPGAQPPQQQPRVVRQPSKRSVAWASQGSVPVAGHHPVIPPPESSAPFVQATPPTPVAVEQQAPVPQPPPMVPPTQGPTDFVQQQPQAPQPQQAQPNGQATNALGAVFPDQAVVEFRKEVELSINAGLPPDVFAARFVDAYPDHSGMLVTMYRPDVLYDVVKSMPDGLESVILRRDGKKWVEKMWQQIVAQHQARAAAAQPQAAMS